MKMHRWMNSSQLSGHLRLEITWQTPVSVSYTHLCYMILRKAVEQYQIRLGVEKIRDGALSGKIDIEQLHGEEKMCIRDSVDGVILLVIFAVYLFWMIQSAKKARTAGDKLEAEEEALAEEEIKILPMWKCIVFIIGGMIAIKFGGDFVVDGASAIAAGFGLSQTLIGLTIVALGTSLPELVTSIVAARKDEVDMALGNVIGSNIFNILLILGVAAAISPVTFLMENIIDIIILIIMSAVVWGFAWTSKKVNRKEGIIMLLMYAVYMVYICIR